MTTNQQHLSPSLQTPAERLRTNPRKSARLVEISLLASGWQTFSYGKLGELTENIRTFALPFENQTYTFKMQYEYDSWNRIQKMTYPDGEVVSYEYNRGGMLNKVFGSVTRNLWEMIEPIQVQGGLTEPDGMMGGGIAVPIDPPVGPIEPQTITYRYPYIDSIIYNVFELKDSVVYGNGTRMSYEYDSLQRLSYLRSYAASGTKMQDITYTYDSASNITHISNSAGSVSGLGGRYEGDYTYDNLYRLVAANGYWKNSRDSLPFSESMNYTANGRILKKTVNARTLNGNHSTTKSSDFRYSYAGHGNQVSTITDNGTFPVVTQSFLWDDCGNVDRWAMLSKTGTQWLRTHTWTEDNRLQTVADNNWFSYYQYDAGGERTYKLTWAGSTSNRSGDRSIYYTPDEATLYASPYFVVTSKGYTKHYYAESERITSQLGKGQFADVGTPVVSDSLVQVKLQAVTGNVEYPATLTVPGSGTFAYLDTLTNQQNATSTLYFYHPDHLGSSSWITTTNGTVKQHLHYLPWGETYVDQKSNRFDGVRYTFSAKEKDTETGYSYFGARYYSSDLSIWLSVDPMASKYPSLSPYVYCANNPVRLVDPNGDTLSPSALFRQSSYFKVYQNLLQSNNTYKRLIADYQGERCHFYFDFSYEMTKRAGSTVWQHKTEGSKVSVTTHSTYYRPDGGDQSEIAMAKTLIHEAVHAFDGLTQRKTPNHDGFDQASVLAGLKEYNSIFNLGYSDEDLEILSWSGLQKSKEYKSFINSRAKENERSYDEEDTYVKTKMTILMFGTISDD